MCCFAGVCTYVYVHLVVRMNWIGTTEASNWIGCDVIFYAAWYGSRQNFMCWLFVRFASPSSLLLLLFHIHSFLMCGCHQCRCALLLILLFLASCTNAWRITMQEFRVYIDYRIICFLWILLKCVFFLILGRCLFSVDSRAKMCMTCVPVCLCVWTIYHNNNWSETTMEQWTEEGCMLIARFISTHWIT